ncbi:hypothetical protein [Aliarcobacter butzleri]|uniref:hypothetical protein n=2 Tax=Aliarcobacter butzleri TaxID=28197 RepID=UPI001EDA6DD0|nr:hypothetical protein [Aliarcobacter butzleri]MCG3692402.1 hypothetical protein [Aliarcobacter butzleri]
MDLVIGIISGGIISWLVTYIYFRKSKKDADIQSENIKKEFNNLNEKVDSILKSESISEEDKTLKLNQISIELKSWIDKLNSDPGEIESKIDMKMNELQNNSYKKSNLLRPYINKIINEIDNIINELNKSGKNISWEKPILPSNLFEMNIKTSIKFVGNIVENIEISYYIGYIMFSIEDTASDGIRKGSLTYLLRLIDDKKIELSVTTKDSLSFINNEHDFGIEKADEIYSKNLRNLFEYILIKRN